MDGEVKLMNDILMVLDDFYIFFLIVFFYPVKDGIM